MDAFFSGLDSRLRMSVKVGDSIMMGLVNSAMEDAYKKSLWKEGDLERLIEKLRFGELAIMQLEWCLRFVRGEMERNQVESTSEHEQLLDDLLETRDRIQARLEESVLAVADKDRDFMRRKEIESRLRLALEVKGEELSSLLAALGSERTKGERASELVRSDEMCAEEEGRMFGELKSSVDQQMSKMRGRLENGRCTLTTLMQKLGSGASPMARLDTGHDGDGMKALSDLYSMAQLLMEFEEMIVDASTVKESIASSFEMMERSISLSKATLDEQQWVMNAEKEIYVAIVEDFLKEVPYNSNVESRFPTESSPPIAVGMNWSALMDDMNTLQNELEILVSQLGMQPKLDGGTKVGTNYPSMSRINSRETSQSEENTPIEANPLPENTSSSGSGPIHIQASEDMSEGQLVAKLMSNHETIVQQKSHEINLSKIEPSTEKGSTYIQNDRNFDVVKGSASLVIARLNAIRSGNARLIFGGQSLFSKNDNDHNVNSSKGFETLEKETRLQQSARQIPEQSNNRSCYHLVRPGLSDEEVLKLIEEKADSDIRCELQNEIYTTIFRDLVWKLTVESIEHFMETFIKDDIHRVIISETFTEWRSIREMIENERLVKEEIDCIIFGQLTKDLICYHDFCVLKTQEGIRSSNTLESFSMIDNIEQVRKLKLLINEPREDKGVDLNLDPKFMTPKIFNSPGNCDIRDCNESDLQAEMLTDKDDASDSVNGKVEQALQQVDSSKLQIRELISISMPLESRNLENDQVDSQLDKNNNVRHSPASNTTFGENHQDGLQNVLVPLTQLSQKFTDFEAVTNEKIGTATLRLRDLNKQLILLVKRVSSLKRNELLYRRAFTRRCYDLQTAEAEVDLLGDEVDLLLGLVQKTYIALDQYSPVLQHYFGIREILNLLGNELGVRHR